MDGDVRVTIAQGRDDLPGTVLRVVRELHLCHPSLDRDAEAVLPRLDAVGRGVFGPSPGLYVEEDGAGGPGRSLLDVYTRAVAATGVVDI